MLQPGRSSYLRCTCLVFHTHLPWQCLSSLQVQLLSSLCWLLRLLWRRWLDVRNLGTNTRNLYKWTNKNQCVQHQISIIEREREREQYTAWEGCTIPSIIWAWRTKKTWNYIQESRSNWVKRVQFLATYLCEPRKAPLASNRYMLLQLYSILCKTTTTLKISFWA